MVSLERKLRTTKYDEYVEYQRQVEAEVLAEFLANDVVNQVVTKHSFVSYSKGRKRRRRYPKEVDLIKYGYFFHLAKNIAWDEIATEILGDIEDAEAILIGRVMGNQVHSLSNNYGVPV